MNRQPCRLSSAASALVPARPRHLRQRPRRAARLARVLPYQVGQAVAGRARPGVGDHRLDLGPVPHDARVGHQPGHVVFAEGGHRRGVEPGEGGPEVLPLAQDGQPGQPGLEALQAEPLEDADVAADRPAPLLVVIGEILGSAQTPGAAQLAVRTFDDAHLRHVLRGPWPGGG